MTDFAPLPLTNLSREINVVLSYARESEEKMECKLFVH